MWLQQPKGPGLCSVQDQSWRFWSCNGGHSLLLSAPLWEECSVCQPLLPEKALGLSSAGPLDAAAFKLPGTAELLLIVLLIVKTESFWISCAGGFPSGSSPSTEKENWLNSFALVCSHPFKWYSTSPRCEL